MCVCEREIVCVCVRERVIVCMQRVYPSAALASSAVCRLMYRALLQNRPII